MHRADAHRAIPLVGRADGKLGRAVAVEVERAQRGAEPRLRRAGDRRSPPDRAVDREHAPPGRRRSPRRIGRPARRLRASTRRARRPPGRTRPRRCSASPLPGASLSGQVLGRLRRPRRTRAQQRNYLAVRVSGAIIRGVLVLRGIGSRFPGAEAAPRTELAAISPKAISATRGAFCSSAHAQIHIGLPNLEFRCPSPECADRLASPPSRARCSPPSPPAPTTRSRRRRPRPARSPSSGARASRATRSRGGGEAEGAGGEGGGEPQEGAHGAEGGRRLARGDAAGGAVHHAAEEGAAEAGEGRGGGVGEPRDRALRGDGGERAARRRVRAAAGEARRVGAGARGSGGGGGEGGGRARGGAGAPRQPRGDAFEGEGGGGGARGGGEGRVRRARSSSRR